jgi:hypothetical protein
LASAINKSKEISEGRSEGFMILSPAVGWGGVYGSLFPEIPESIYKVIPVSSPDGLWAMPYRSFESLGPRNDM